MGKQMYYFYFFLSYITFIFKIRLHITRVGRGRFW